MARHASLCLLLVLAHLVSLAVTQLSPTIGAQTVADVSDVAESSGSGDTSGPTEEIALLLKQSPGQKLRVCANCLVSKDLHQEDGLGRRGGCRRRGDGRGKPRRRQGDSEAEEEAASSRRNGYRREGATDMAPRKKKMCAMLGQLVPDVLRSDTGETSFMTEGWQSKFNVSPNSILGL